MSTERRRQAPVSWESYRRQAWERANLHTFPITEVTRNAYLGLGLCGEVGEALEATAPGDFLDELGDVFWYVAMIEAVFLAQFQIDWTLDLRTHGMAVRGRAKYPPLLLHNACRVAEQLKRPILGRDLDHRKLHAALSHVGIVARHLSHATCGSVDAVLQGSVDKNHKRYGAEGPKGKMP